MVNACMYCDVLCILLDSPTFYVFLIFTTHSNATQPPNIDHDKAKRKEKGISTKKGRCVPVTTANQHLLLGKHGRPTASTPSSWALLPLFKPPPPAGQAVFAAAQPLPDTFGPPVAPPQWPVHSGDTRAYIGLCGDLAHEIATTTTLLARALLTTPTTCTHIHHTHTP